MQTEDSFDSLSRNFEENQRIGALTAKTVSYQFDIASSNSVFQPSALIYPDGRQLNNAYDNLDRLVSRTDNGQSSPIGAVQYIGVSRVATLAFQNDTRLTYFAGAADVGYDGLRRIVNHRWESFGPSDPLGAGILLVGFAYTYDRANNRLSQEKLHDPGNSELYSYRSDYELTSFERGTLNATKTAIVTPTATTGALQNQSWDLDGTGNWTANTHTTGGVTGTENRSHSNLNEIAMLSGSPYASNVNFSYQFDANGNLLDDGKLLYKWDALNRLQQVFRKSDGQLIGTYTYDAGNRRFRKIITSGGLDGTAPNGTTDFYCNGWQTVEEHNGADTITQQYVYGMGLIELWTLDDRRGGISVLQLNDGNPNQRKFYHADVLGSVYALTNEAGEVLVGLQYDAYGRPTEFGQGQGGMVTFGTNVVPVGTTVAANPYLYGGMRLDRETRHYYDNERYYDPDKGRFESRDAAGDWNLYCYVHNQPTIAIDPSGKLFWIPIIIVAVVAIGVIGCSNPTPPTPKLSQMGTGSSDPTQYTPPTSPPPSRPAVTEPKVQPHERTDPEFGSRLFPNLRPGTYRIIGPETPQGGARPCYNCLAHASGNTKEDVDIPRKQGGPATVADAIRFFEGQKPPYTRSPNCESEPGKEKIAIFGNPGSPGDEETSPFRHVAKEAPEGGGWWESKLGQSCLILHRLKDLEMSDQTGGQYGKVRICMERPKGQS